MTSRASRSLAHVLFALVVLTASPAFAQTPPPPSDDEPTTAAEEKKVVPPNAPVRKQDLRPAPSEPPDTGKSKFTADPIGDGGVLIIGATLGTLSGAILSTDEIRPQQISPTFDSNRLLGIDRLAIRQRVSEGAGTLSDIGLFTAIGYSALDTVLDGFREGRSAALVDGIMYVEAFLVTQAVTNVAKIAFRRPRPRAYIERDAYIRAGGDPLTYNNASIDSALSFFSGHAAQTAALAGAATYIAFSRSPRTVRPWLTLFGGMVLTGVVSYGRVRSAAHFPTDVMAGSAVGAGIGALVVHLHREDAVKQRPVWIGMTPVEGGGIVGASGLF